MVGVEVGVVSPGGNQTPRSLFSLVSTICIWTSKASIRYLGFFFKTFIYASSEIRQ